MNNLTVFEFDSQEVRVINIDSETWFVAKDVCRVLEVGNTSQALTRLDDDEKGVISNDTPGGSQKMAIVSESGFYSLTLGSRKPQAKPFKRWVTHDVLPSIRKTGKYEATPEPIALPPADIRVTNFVGALKDLEIDISNPRYKQAIQDQVLNKILGQPTIPESAERWLGVIEKAEEMGYPIDIVTRFRSALGRFVKSHNLDCRSESRLCNGTQRPINLYRDCAELSEAISEYMDAKILKVS